MGSEDKKEFGEDDWIVHSLKIERGNIIVYDFGCSIEMIDKVVHIQVFQHNGQHAFELGLIKLRRDNKLLRQLFWHEKLANAKENIQR